MRTPFRFAVSAMISIALLSSGAAAGREGKKAAKPEGNSAQDAKGGVAESWTSVDGSNTGVYSDKNGSKVSFYIVDGPLAGEKAVKVSAEVASGGYAGVRRDLSADLSKAGCLRFFAKSTVAQEAQIGVKDKYGMQYVARFPVDTDWAEVVVPLSKFQKDPSFKPPETAKGRRMDLSRLSGLSFSPQATGASVLMVGPVMWAEGVVEPEVAVRPTPKPVFQVAPTPVLPRNKGVTITLQDFAVVGGGMCGVFTDPKGSKFDYTYRDTESEDDPDDKMLAVYYKLLSGGWCGMWYRSGDNWDGVDLSKAVAILAYTFTSKPLIIGLALKDKNNNQYIANCSMSTGGQWEWVMAPMADFILDPGYTPPDAIRGAPKDFSQVKTFNISPKTEGEFTLAIDWVKAVQ